MTPWRRCPSGRLGPSGSRRLSGDDVVVEAEEVVGVVLLLEADEPLIVRSVGFGNPTVVVAVEVIDIDAVASWREVVPYGPGPFDTGRSLIWLDPLGDGVEVP